MRSSHYAPVGEVLIDTFAELLGERFTPSMRQAWKALYGAVAEVMCDASCGTPENAISSIQINRIEPKAA